MTKTTPKRKNERRRRVPEIWLVVGGVLIVCLVVLGGWLIVSRSLASRSTEAPEAQRVLDVQATMPFQILIPAYLPKGFDRAGMQINVNQSGPGGEPMVQLTYRTRKGEALFVREWVPVNPALETLAASRPIETKWGKGWLLRQGEGLIAIWADIGPLRASIYTHDQEIVPVQNLLAIAENMGPASNRQVFSFVVDPSEVREVAPPPPVEAAINAEGVQEVDLVVTPGGYSPLRFSVKQGVPVRLSFRQLGEVGCGNELILPTADGGTASVLLESPADRKVLDFTPQQTGQYQFFCSHTMYRGVMTVRE